jgi:hypothetical protein
MSDRGDKTLLAIGAEADDTTEGLKSHSKDLYILFNWSNEKHCVIGILSGMVCGDSSSKNVKMTLVGGLLEDVVDRLNGQHKKER